MKIQGQIPGQKISRHPIISHLSPCHSCLTPTPIFNQFFDPFQLCQISEGPSPL